MRRPGRWLGTGLLVLLLAVAINVAVTNKHFQWDVVGHYMFGPTILKGLLLTLELTAISMAIGFALGVVLAVMRMSPSPVITGVSSFYIWFFRGTPLLVQLIFWYYLSALFPVINIGIPFGGPVFVSGDANTVITPIAAAIIGLALNEAAYAAEIVRGGILSVERGQLDAASALGMNRLRTTRRIVLPQAMRVIVPPTGNEVITMLKSTSLVSVASVSELLYSAQQIYASTYQTIPLLIVTALWYLTVTSVLTMGQYFLERRVGRGFHQSGGGSRTRGSWVLRSLRIRPQGNGTGS